MKCTLSTLLLALIGPFSISAMASSLFDPEDGMVDMSHYLQDNQYGFLPVPMVITEPAVGYGGGLFGLFLHGKGTRKGDNFIPPPMTAFGGGATQNGTWFVGGGHRHTWNDDHIRYLVMMGYANIKLDIYGDGLSHFDQKKAIHSQTKGYGGLQKLLFRVGDSPVFVGASQVYAKTDISAENPVVNRVWQQVFGQESTSSALGVVAEYDTTDNFFYPKKGLSVQGEYRFYRSLLGGDYHYNQFSLDGKYFFPLSRTLTLAVAGNYQSLTHHDNRLTPMARPYIELRGISRYRYQGDYVTTAQTQLAWEFTPRWILQGFVGVGSAADEAHALWDQTEVAWGTGFRYLIARQYGLHTGIDIAFSEHEQAVYFNVGSGL
ncbi:MULTISPECIES: BamA/TamA family outer membrane protein [unclassified Raoultella]|uniref:BamA/TamA family outer membrane protein n=1 Tax=unclassified Raoultella TaxID=2627600 RepID=UPI00135CEFEB|nr:MULTISPECIES: BamA/TamA family outer membrane protein [unclassified Raoultella]